MHINVVYSYNAMSRQWREEREKLIQCIHLQQLELTQRSTAAHERAADIAKVGCSAFCFCIHHSIPMTFYFAMKKKLFRA